MKVLLHSVNTAIMIFWGVVLYSNYAHGMDTCPVIYSIGLGIHGFISFMVGFAMYHQYTFSRACCWQCFRGEHDTCRRSEDARIESRLYRR